MLPTSWDPEEDGLARRTVVAGGYRLSYVTGGQGEPVFLLHGIGSDCSVWRQTLPALASHFTVYAPDLLGCGLSEKPPIDYSIETLARSVAALADALGVERLAVIGHSLGGGVALKLFQLYPERISRLVLVASGGLGRELHWILRINALPGAHAVLRLLTDPRSRVPSVGLALRRRRMLELRRAYEAYQPTILHRLRDPQARLAFIQMARSVSDLRGQTVSALPLLPTIEAPVLLIWGARDAILPVAHGEQAVGLLRRGHLHVLPASAHRPQLEEADAFNAAVLAFLQAETWPPNEAGQAAVETLAHVGSTGRRTKRLVGVRRRQRTARVALALAAVGLAAGAAGWRYAPRSSRRLMPRRWRVAGSAAHD